MKSQKKYYEHFQVEDVLTFSSGQLLLAKTLEGTQVVLHEIKDVKSLPAGYKESLLSLKHAHLAPMKIHEDDQSAVIVHPALSGDPLTLLVTPEKPFDYRNALLLYRVLLKTVIDLSAHSLPISTTLDPRNIIMEGNHPYLLYFDIHPPGHKIQHDEAWRGLLYYLITGEKSSGAVSALSENHLPSHIPAPIRSLIKESLNQKRSLEEVYRLAEKVEIPMTRKGKEEPGRSSRIVPVAVSMVVMIGIAAGYFFIQWEEETAEKDPSVKAVATDHQQGIQEQIPNIRFSGFPVTSQLADSTVRGVTHIRFHLTQDRLGPFSAMLLSEETSYQYGLSIDSLGELSVVGEQQEEETRMPSARPSKSYFLYSKLNYQIDMFLIPNERLRISVKNLDNQTEWLTVGPIMRDENYRLRFRGNERTDIKQVVLSKYTNAGDAKQLWSGEREWDLAHGETVIDSSVITLKANSQLDVTKKGLVSFQLSYPEESSSAPVQINLESIEGLQYKFIWRKNRLAELVQVDGQFEPLVSKQTSWSWNPNEPLKIKIHNRDNMIGFELAQNDHNESISYVHPLPLTLKRITVAAEEDMNIQILKEGE